MDVRTKIIFGVIFFLVLGTTFFSGEWDKWLQAIIFFITFLIGFLVYRQVDLKNTKQFSLATMWRSPFLYLVILVLVMIVSSFFSIDSYDSWSQTLLFISFAVVGVSSYIFFNLNKASTIAVRSIVAVGTVVSLIGLVMFLNQSSARVMGFLFNANAISSYLLLVFPLAIVILVHQWHTKYRWLVLGAVAFIGTAFLLTYSYTAWVSFILPVYFLVRRYRHHLLTRKVMMRMVVVLVIGFVALVGFRYQQTRDISDAVQVYQTISYEQFISSFSQRAFFSQSAVEIFLDNPFIGTGLNTYQSAYPQYFHTVLEQPRYAHNYYLQTAAELGIFGLVALAGFIYFLFRRAVRAIRSEENILRKDILLALTLSLAGSAIHSLFDFGWQFPGVFILFWVEVGLLLALTRSHYSTEVTTVTKSGRILVGIMVSIVLLVLFGRGVSVFIGVQAFDRAAVAIENVDPTAAAQYYTNGLRFDPDPASLYKMVGDQTNYRSISTSFDYSELVDQMNQHLDNYPASYIGHWTLGRLHFSQGMYPEAITAYQQAVKYNPAFRPDMFYDLAFAYVSQEEYDLAKETIRAVLVHYPVGIKTSNPNLRIQLGFLYVLLGDIYHEEVNDDLAQWHYAKALRINPSFDLAQQKLNELLQ